MNYIDDALKDLIEMLKGDKSDPYYLQIQMNGELLLRLYRKAFQKGMSLEEFVFDCIIKGLNNE